MGALALALAGQAGGSLIQGLLANSAAQKAAGTQAQAAEYGANLQSQAEQQALALQEQEYLAGQAEVAPYLNAGYGALGQLEEGMGLPVTTPALTGVSPATPATLAPQNNASAQQAQANSELLSNLGLGGNLTAPSVQLGVSNNSQAQFQQAFESAGIDIQNAVASGLITKDQGIAAMNRLQQQLNLYGSGGYGKAQPTINQAESELNGYLNNITGGSAHLYGAQGGNTLAANYIPAGAQGWEGSAPGTGASLANYAIANAIGSGTVPLSSLSKGPSALPVSSATPRSVTMQASLPPTQANAGVTNGGIAGTTGSPTQTIDQQKIGTSANITPTALNQQWNTAFVAPTAQQALNEPGVQFALQQGQQAIERSAAAQGSLLTGGTAKDLANYEQNAAEGFYNDAYNRALQQYQQAYNIFQNNQTNQINRLSALAGTGQTAASQLSGAGANYANSAGSIGMGGANAVANQLNNAAAANASGYVGGANAVGGALGSMGDALGMYAMLSSLAGKNGAKPTAINTGAYGG